MNSKIKKVIWVIINAAILGALTLLQRNYFPETIEVSTVDSTAVIQEQSKIDSLETTILDLKVRLEKKPKIVIRKVPIHTIIRKDTIVYRDTTLIKEIVIRDTIKVTNTVEIDESAIPSLLDKQYVAETFILSDKDITVVKIRKKYIKEGDMLYFIEGEDIEKSLAIFHDKNSIPRKIKFSVPTIYILGISNEKDIENRFDKIIKNRNKF